MSAFAGLVLLPFKLLISALFSFFISASGNYGVSLIAVSFCVTLLVLPLYLLAEKWESEEKALRLRMYDDIEDIKAAFGGSGSKYFYMQRAAHLIYGYKSWYAVKTSLGIVIQIPFFFAAYSVLSHYQGYAGVPFLLIRDLSMPDMLLGKINALPFLMTAVNIASSFYYTQSRSLKENAKLLAMSGVFLALLYDSPSALLIYWTLNNVFAFLKNIILRKLGISKPVQQEHSADRRSFLGEMIRKEPVLPVLFFFLLLLSAQACLNARLDIYYKYLFPVFLAAMGISQLLAFKKWKLYGKTVLLICADLGVFVFLALWLIKEEHLLQYVSFTNQRFIITFLMDMGIFLPLYFKRAALQKTVGSEAQKAIPSPFFFLLLAVFLFYIILYCPLNFYFAYADYHVITPFENFFILCICTFCAPGAFFSAWYLFSKSTRAFLYRAVSALFIVSLTWSLFLQLKSIGLLDTNIFQNVGEDVITVPLLLCLVDAALITAIWHISAPLLSKYRRIFNSVLVIALVFFSANLVFQYSAFRRGNISGANKTRDEMIGETASRHVFTTTGMNVVYFLADGFSGNYIGRLLAESQKYAETLDGFTWYPDCLASSSYTAMSIPGMLAGPRYTPLELNKNDKTGNEEINITSRLFFDAINRAGFAITSTQDVEDTSFDYIYKIEESPLVHYWKERNGIFREKDHPSGILIMLSLFNSAPYFMKNVIYDESYWHITRTASALSHVRRLAINRFAYIDLLPELCSIADGQNRFFYIHTNLPHAPWGIDKNGNIVSEFSGEKNNSFETKEAALYSAKKTIDVLGLWLDWMKQNNVYDNTVIVVASDHGNWLEDADITYTGNEHPEFISDTSRSCALLMVKGLNARGSLRRDDLPVCSSDIPGLLKSESGIAFDVPDFNRQDLSMDRPRHYSSLATNYATFYTSRRVPYRNYEVTGSLYDSGAWKRIE